MKVRIAVLVAALIAIAVTLLQVERPYRVATLNASELSVRGNALKAPEPLVDNCSNIQRAVKQRPTGNESNTSTPLNSDQLAIYKAVLKQWTGGERGRVSVAVRTVTLDENDLSNCECVRDFDITSLQVATVVTHSLTKNVVPSGDVVLVDNEAQAAVVAANDPARSIRSGGSVEAAVDNAFAHGLFTLSEIAFNSAHTRALVRYSFVCGSLCGSGGVWVFEKVDGAWKKTGQNCRGWVS